MNDIVAPNHAQLLEIASSQAGYFTAVQARTCGFSYPLLAHHADKGRFRRVRRGLYRIRHFPSSPREEVIAGWLAIGRDVAVISHESALEILELADVLPDRVHVTVPRALRGRRSPAGVELHTTTRFPMENETVVRDGLRLTSPTRTIADSLRAGMAPEQGVMALRETLRRGLAARAELRNTAAEHGGIVEILVRQVLEESQGS